MGALESLLLCGERGREPVAVHSVVGVHGREACQVTCPVVAQVATQPVAAAQRLAGWATRLRAGDVPDEVREAAVLHLLDTAGCALAALGTGEGMEAAAVMAGQGGAPEATAVGSRQRIPSSSAALVNGMAAHALDFDDTHEQAICHVGTVVGPAALAAAEKVGASGSDLVTAFVAGSEVVCRLGMAAPRAFHARGFHPTSVCGVFGAATAAARLLGLGEQQATAALGLAGSLASGIFEYLADGSPTKPLHAGWAAHGGVLAAELARAGARGPATVVEGRFGLYATHAEGGVPAELEQQLADLGERWETPAIAFKPYPACHFLHTAVDAAVEAASARPGLGPGDIAEIAVRVPSAGVPLVLEPAADKPSPRTPYDAKFSLPYSVAFRLVHGRLDVTSYTAEAIRDEAVQTLAARTTYTPWPDAEAPSPFAGAAELVLRDGTRLAATVEHPRGSRANPMTPAEVREKFTANAGLALPAGEAEALAARLLALDGAPDVRSLRAG
jgi:2-methylcitrate dehydratase PrpD